MQLREIIDGVLRAKKWTQNDLATRIGVSQSRLSKMRYGPDWQDHFEILLRLLEVCEEAKVAENEFRRLRDSIRGGLSQHGQRQFDDLLSQAHQGITSSRPPSTNGRRKKKV